MVTAPLSSKSMKHKRIHFITILFVWVEAFSLSQQFFSHVGMFSLHSVQRRMISVDNFFVFLRLLFFALLLLYVN